MTSSTVAARRVGEIDDDRPRLQQGDQLPAEVGQAALRRAMGRTGERGIEEVTRPHHPVAGLDEAVDAALELRWVAAQRVGALEGEEASREPGIRHSSGEVVAQVDVRPDEADTAVRRRGERDGTLSEVEGSAERIAHGRPGPAEAEGDEGDVVERVGLVAFHAHVPWHPRRDGEPLERHVALDEARDVDVAVAAPDEEVAAPEERVGVEVDDPERGMELASPIRDRDAIARDGVPSPISSGDEASTDRPAGDGDRGDSCGYRDPRRDTRRRRRQLRPAPHRPVRPPTGTARTSSRNGSDLASRSSAVPTKAAHRGLDLELHGRVQAELGERLGVESLVGAEQLDGLRG